MADLVVILWNLEEFGTRYGKEDLSAGTSRAGLVAAILQDMKADVLIIQEFRKQGTTDLAALAKALNAYKNGNWNFDWIPGAINKNWVSNTKNLPAFTDLEFLQPANSEGYAVVWKDDAIESLGDVPSAGKNQKKYTARAQHYINLGFVGRELEIGTTIPYISAKNNNKRIIQSYPFRACDNVNVKSTRWLRSSKNKEKDEGEVVYDSNDTLGSIDSSRRPAYISAINRHNEKVTIICYHAPNGAFSCFIGPLIGLTSVQTMDRDCVFAGDWNIVSSGNRQCVLTGAQKAGLRNSNVMGLKDSKPPGTMIHSYYQEDGIYYWSESDSNIYSSYRDTGVSKKTVSLINLQVVDVITDVFKKNSKSVKYINDNLDNLIAQIDDTNGDNLFFPYPIWNSEKQRDTPGNYIIESAAFNFDFDEETPGYTKKTGRAIMYEAFVSDHLPIKVTF